MRAEPLAAARAEAVWELLAAEVRPVSTLELPPENAFGFRLAEDAVSDADYPPFDRALMDGFAVRCADFAGDSTVLRNRGLARAGGPQSGRVEAGTCVQINTGAPLPPGADAVVMIEQSRPLDGGRVELRGRAESGQNIERRAALRRQRDLLLPAGTWIGAGETAGLISGGVRSVRVFRPPGVALLTTGDELAAAGAALQPGQIPESNSFAINPLIRAQGARIVSSGRCPDDEQALHAALLNGLAQDVLIVTGGMSRGSHDLVPQALEALGVRWLVTSLDLKPGKPTRIGRSPRDGWVLGLPGNPVSCVVCFLLFGRPMLSGLQGARIGRPAFLFGTAGDALPANGARPMFQPGHWGAQPDGAIRVRPIAWRGSGDPFGLMGANALVYRPDRAPPAAAGAPLPFLPIDLPL